MLVVATSALLVAFLSCATFYAFVNASQSLAREEKCDQSQEGGLHCDVLDIACNIERGMDERVTSMCRRGASSFT